VSLKTAGGFGTNLLLAGVFCSIILIPAPASSQSVACDVAPSSDWNATEDPGDYLWIEVPGSIEVFGDRESGLKPLDKDISTEWSDGAWGSFPGIRVENESATVISLALEPGYRYTFCIDFSSKGDAYLLTGSNLDMYTVDFYCDEDGLGRVDLRRAGFRFRSSRVQRPVYLGPIQRCSFLRIGFVPGILSSHRLFRFGLVICWFWRLGRASFAPGSGWVGQ